jgi:hypothetical protein
VKTHIDGHQPSGGEIAYRASEHGVRLHGCVLAFVLGGCTTEPTFCRDFWPEDLPVTRPLFVHDSTGRDIESARVARIFAPDSVSAPVPPNAVTSLDRSGRKGRAAMTLRVTAAGFQDTVVSLRELCASAGPPVIVVMTAAR